jgi:ATP-dependent exoDNAse (exonuclease V) beta subunit
MLLPAPQTRRPEARLSGLRTAGFDAAREAEQLREDAEERRLLYVACTRARDWFVLPWMDRRGAYTRILAEAFDPHKAAGVERVDRTKLTQPPSAARPVRVQLGQPEGRDWEQVEKLIATRAAWRAAREREWPSLTAGVVKLTPHKLGEREHFRGEAGGVTAGGGIEIGRGVHEALARCDLRDVEAAVKLFPAGEKLIRAALTHELMKRVLAADEFHREMPVVWQSPDGLLEGYIDLLFREGDGLVIVDYKTDAKPDARLYQGQLAAYAAAVEAITGRRVVEKMLFFLSAGSVERV